MARRSQSGDQTLLDRVAIASPNCSPPNPDVKNSWGGKATWYLP